MIEGGCEMPACCNFEVACSFLGWGDPGDPNHRAVWFVGIEGGGAPWTPESIVHLRGRYFTSWNDANANPPAQAGPVGQVNRWISKMCCGVSNAFGQAQWRRHWQEYRDIFLPQPNSRVFLTNCHPLWKRRQDEWPDTYLELFGFGPGDMEYIQRARDKRYPQIRRRWELCHPQATICFGEGHWCHFRDLFELDERPAQDRLCAYEDQHILLIPFLGQAGPAGPMNNQMADNIIHQLQQWNVALP
jgi:hypothetical protein